MLEHVLIVALAGVLYGWLWASPDAHLLDPIRGPLENYAVRRRDLSWLEPESRTFRVWRRFYVGTQPPAGSTRVDRPGWDWVLNRLGCPVCMGFDGTVAAHLALTGGRFSWASIALLGAANGAHVAFMTTIGK